MVAAALAKWAVDSGMYHARRLTRGSPPPAADIPTVAVDDLDPFSYFQNSLMAYAGQTGSDNAQWSTFDGGKFFGGFGDTQIWELDYWTLRARSVQLFTENPYARGIVRRLVTNEINTGLTPELFPDEQIIGVPENSLDDWTDTVENRFGLYGKNPKLCDWKQESTFGAIQRAARMTAIVAGDVLAVLRQPRGALVPATQLISGESVQTPFGSNAPKLAKGRKIKHGVELDKRGRKIAFWVLQENGKFERLPAYGRKSGRRIAWLIYGTENLIDNVRGTPLLSLMLQSLKEIDRYRDSAQRKAVINSILALFIQKDNDKPGTLPVMNSAVRNTTATATDSDGGTRNFRIADQYPGVIMEELQTGEKPVGFNQQGIDTSFGPFEEAILRTFAWANEIPPEILFLSFSNNYSASQAAINEFRMYLNLKWCDFGETFCTPVQIEWMISEVLNQKIEAAGFLTAWRTSGMEDVFGAWTSVDWYGSIKPSTDLVKQAKGSKLLVDECWSTNAREARINTGTKFSKNVKRVARENKQKAEAMRPMLELKKEFGESETESALAEFLAEAIEEQVDDALESRGVESV